jgi:hypothetical protein
MDKIMPVIEMKKEPEPEPAATNNLPDRAEPDDKEIIEKIQNDLLDDISDEGDSLVEVTERVIPTEDEVFNDPPPPKVKAVAAEEDPPTTGVEFEEKKGKRKYVRKKEMTQKQRDHLAKIRVIAQEKRKQKKLEMEQLKKEKEEQKQKEKEEKQIKIAEERILKKQRQEQEEINKKNQIPATPQVQTGFTREDMEKAMFSAISSYETIRKAEKAEKKKRELAEARERQMHRTLQQAIQPQQPPDQWRQFFS